MATLLITHPACLEHVTPAGHPERADRLRAVLNGLDHADFNALVRREAPRASVEQIARTHPRRYVAALEARIPTTAGAPVYLDGDTVVGAGSWEAALRAAGGAIAAVDAVVGGEVANAFCAVRPPGHHAEPETAMGFCLFNNVAIAALHARAVHGLERIAVMDFDVHHGNGTQAMFWDDPGLFYASTHEHPNYPGTGAASETGAAGNIVNAPLGPRSDGAAFRAAMTDRILPAMEAFAPDLVLISAGFDAHAADPLATLQLNEDDFDWATRKLCGVAARHCGGRLASVLEGGYDLAALARSTQAHVRALMAA